MKNKLFLPLLATLLLTASCAQEEAPRPAAPAPAEAIVEYAPAEASTRAISHEALPAHERIKSLTYLLYDEQGDLVKRREIPDIATMQSGDWPMRRATMTWAQREALKDTLRTGQSYTAVFVANADPSLFGGEQVLHATTPDDGVETPLPLTDVYLSLPRTTPFTDHNMFYLSVVPVTPSALTDRDHPLSCSVQLSRVVSRTDFFCDDYEGWGSDYANNEVRKYTDEVYSQVVATMQSTRVPLKIEQGLKRFTDAFALYATGKGWFADEIFDLWVADFVRVLNNEVNYGTYFAGITPTDELAIKDFLYSRLLLNARLQQLWQPWKGLTARVAYTSGADRFYPAAGTSGSGAGDPLTLSPILDIVPTADAAENTFTLIGFGENPGASDATAQNRMKEVQLYADAAATTLATTLPLTANVQLFATQQANGRVQLNYVPVKTLTYNNTTPQGTTYRLAPVDIEGQIRAGMGSLSAYEGRMKSFFETEEAKEFGTGLNDFILEITLPDLSRPDALTIQPEWSVRE